MECPKCHTVLKDTATVCPKCHKVLVLKCPNCGSLSDSSVCAKCGYTILVKCSKCSKLVPYEKETCPKCKFPLSTSLAYQECESDEIASIIIKFGSLKKIKRLLKSSELYTKFYFKLQNLLMAHIKGVDCKFIKYGDVFEVNICKELSFETSSNKAVRLALKILNAFVTLNSNIIEELGIPLNLSLSVVKKSSEDLQKLKVYENNVKLLTTNKGAKKYLKGLEITLDQYVRDSVSKDFKTDSLYALEQSGQSIMFYEILLDSYILPPSEKSDENTINIKKIDINSTNESPQEDDKYSFKVFGLNAKCSFKQLSSPDLLNDLKSNSSKIISIRSRDNLQINTGKLHKLYKDNEYRVLRVACTEEMNFKPWGFFVELVKDYYGLSCCNGLNDLSKINQNDLKLFKPIFDILIEQPVQASTAEDARFMYMEIFNKFLSRLEKTVIIIENFDNLDDTSIQTLELYFDKFKRIKPTFLFITSDENSAHSKIKSLLRTDVYTEYVVKRTPIEDCLANIKLDARDFIQSFYYEKIEEYYQGSSLYFDLAINHFKNTGVLLDFDSKLLVKENKATVLPKELSSLYKSVVKHLSKNMDLSLIFAYSTIFGARIDFNTLNLLGIKEVDKLVKIIEDNGLAVVDGEFIYFNNFKLISSVVQASLKKAAEEFLVKTTFSKLGKVLDTASLSLLLGKLELFKDEYLSLWKNSQFAIKTGDYDAYLKNCLGFLSLVEHIDLNFDKEVIEENKKDVYNNILNYLYSYSPAKIYFLENILLMDAINSGDDEKIVKLSNLMLQGALITSNYADAVKLLNNILSKMPNPKLLVNGVVNTKFLLLSLVRIEILYNVGDFKSCIELANDILNVLSFDMLSKVKPASFSTNLFVSHLLETFRLVAFAKLFVMDEDLEDYFAKIALTLNSELPEVNSILALRDFFAGRVYTTGDIENASPYSKVIYLILQEISVLKDDYMRFAQNIYQAKLLALDLHQKELELFCDLLIAYAYSKIGLNQKAEMIYADILEVAENSAIFNITLAVKYLMALISSPKDALLLVSESLAAIQKYENQAKIFYVLFEKLYIDIVEKENFSAVDIESEKLKLLPYKDKLKQILGEDCSNNNSEEG